MLQNRLKRGENRIASRRNKITRRGNRATSGIKVALGIALIAMLLVIPLDQGFLGHLANLSAQEALSGREILERVAGGQSGLTDYVADSQVEVKAPGINWPKMKIRVYFKSPGKVHVESDRLALVPANNLVIPDVDRLLAGGVEIKRLEDEKTGSPEDGTNNAEYVVLVSPGATSPGRREGVMRLMVDPGRWLITRAQMQDSAGGEVRVSFSYTQVEGFWLPALIKGEGQVRGVHLPPITRGGGPGSSGPSGFPGGTGGGGNNPGAGEDQGMFKLSFAVSYHNYRVNTGLSDKIFESRK